MNKNDIIICPSCGGKGHVFDGIALLTIIGIFTALFERNNPDGLTREQCNQCKGRGFIKVNTE